MLRMVECETNFTQQPALGRDVNVQIESGEVDAFSDTHVQFLHNKVREREAHIARIEHTIEMLESQLNGRNTIDNLR